MSRKKRFKIRLNNIENLETLMHEVYNDANFQIAEAQKVINEMVNSSDIEDVGDLTSIAKEKATLLKVKDSSIKIKLDLAKLEHEVLKANGASSTTTDSGVQTPGKIDFGVVRDFIKNGGKDKEELNT